MNRRVVLFFLALLSLTACGQAWAQKLTLIQNGRPNATIVVQADAPERVQTAATELQEYIQKVSGVRLPLKNDGIAAEGVNLHVGKTAAAREGDLPVPSLNSESYAITMRDGNLFLAGHYPAPTAFAVYSFIEKYLGVRWFAPGEAWEYVPRNNSNTLTLDVKAEVSVPATSPRIWSGHQWNADWQAWNLRNKTVQSEKVERRNFQNNMYRVFPPSKYAKNHPEYYPLMHGKRWIPPSDSHVYWYPCTGNPAVQQGTVAYINDFFTNNPNADSFSLGMDDVAYICECPLCRAMDADPGDYEKGRFSNRFFAFVNIIAKEVKKTHPDKYIGTLIYRIARELPEKVPVMEDNVFGYITQSSANWYQPGMKAEDDALTLAWSKRVKHLSRYDYLGLGTFAPRVFTRALNDSLEYDKSLGLEGMYIEVYTFLPHTAPMIWALAQKQWQNDLKMEALLDEFYAKMFPGTAPIIKRYLQLLEDSWMTPRPEHVIWEHRDIVKQAVSISPEVVQEGLQLLDEALAQAKSPEEKHRIDVVRGGLQYASYAINGYDVAKRLAASPVTNETQAQQTFILAEELGKIMTERAAFWPQARQRKDLLGENLQGLYNFGRETRGEGYLQTDTAPLENFTFPTLISLLNWYRQTGQIAKSAQLVNVFPARSSFRGALTAWQWVQQNQLVTLIKNGNLESDVSSQKVELGAGQQTQFAPADWATWHRVGVAKFERPNGRSVNGRGFSIAIPRKHGEETNETGTLLQSIPVKAGQKYFAMAWVKLKKEGTASVSLRFSTPEGWAKGPDANPRTAGGKIGEWQPLMLLATAPNAAHRAALMLGLDGPGEVVFDDAAVYLVD
jgi:hypothetical protein